MNISGPTQATIYCRRCSYELDGLNSHACPECGTPFDPNNRRSWRKNTKRYRWVRRIVIAMVLILLSPTIPAAWIGWGYFQAERTRAIVQQLDGETSSHVIGPLWLRRSIDEAYLTRIRVIQLRGSGVDDAAMRQLRGRSCELLILHDTAITNAGLADIARIKGLEDLRLGATPLVQGHGFAALNKSETLQTLTINIKDTSVTFLAALKKINSLTISHVDPGDLTTLPRMTNLRTLYITGNKLNLDDFRAITRNTQLTKLTLDTCGITPESVRAISSLTKLRALMLSGRGPKGQAVLNSESMQIIGKFTQLDRLTLSCEGLVADDLQYLAGLNQLTHLGIADSGLPGSSLQHLIALPKLRTLWLRDWQISEGLSAMQQMPALQNVTVITNHFSTFTQTQQKWKNTLPIINVFYID